jgi:hypothetical protein
MNTIRPTHHCFDDALDYIEMRVLGDPALARGETLIVVHAICLTPEGPNAGEPFAHAWCEEGAAVWDAGILDGCRIFFQVERAEWYRKMRPVRTTKYTIREACEENYRTNHYGPWDPVYRALIW